MSPPPSPPHSPSSPSGEEENPLTTNPGADTTHLHTALADSLSTLNLTHEQELARALELSKADHSLHSESVEAENLRREKQHEKDLALALEASRMDEKAVRDSLEAEERRQEEELGRAVRESLLTSRFGGGHGFGTWGGMAGEEGESSRVGEAMGRGGADESEGDVPKVPPVSPHEGKDEGEEKVSGSHDDDDEHEHDHEHEHEEPKEDGKGGIVV